MTIAKTVEISATSENSFEDAIQSGIAKASETLKNIKGAWVSEQKVEVEGSKVVAFRVDLRVTFVLD